MSQHRSPPRVEPERAGTTGEFSDATASKGPGARRGDGLVGGGRTGGAQAVGNSEDSVRRARQAMPPTPPVQLTVKTTLTLWVGLPASTGLLQRLLHQPPINPESSSRGAQIRTGDPLLPKYGC
jgi:hypothetical protein